MKEFSIWSREVNGSTPFVPTLPAGYRNPQLDFDIPRAYLLGVNPRGILQFIHPGLIDIWKSSGYLDPVRWTENDIWLCIVLHSQYPDASSAEQALESTIMDWSIHDPQSRWYDFLNRFQDVLARLTLAGVLYGRPASDVRTSRSFVKQTFLANVGILRLFVDLYPSIHADPNGLITSFIPIVGREHRTWCEGKTYPQQCNNRLIDPIIDPDSGQWQSVPPRLQKAARAAQNKLTRAPPSPAPQVPPAPQETQRPPAPRFDVEKHRRQRVPTNGCVYCFSPNHVVKKCPDRNCRQSDYFVPRNGRKPGPRRGGDKDSTRGAPPNKKNKYDVFFYTKEHRFIPHTPTPGHQTVHSGRVQSNSPPSSDLSPDDVVRYVASSPVPLREGSRRAGRRKDIKDSKLFGWAKFDDKLAHVFGHGTNPDALSRNLGIPDSNHNVSIPDSASTCHHVSIPDSSSTRHHFGIPDSSSTCHHVSIPDSSSTRHHFGIPDSSSTRHHFGIPDSYYDSSGHHLVQGDGYNDVDLHSIDYIDHTILSIDPAQPIKKPQLIKLNILINDVPVTGVIDTAASCSVITKDLASSSHMKILPDSIRYVSANNVTSSSLGTAQGVLSFRLGSIANLVRLNHRLPIIPGSDLLLIGIDILSQLGLLNEDGLSLRLDKEHSVILLSEAEFDDRILMADESSRPAKVIPFASQLTDSGCTITLDDPDKSDSLVALLHQFQEVFSSLPHPDGIDCPPMEIPFRDPTAIVKLPPRRLNPEKQKVAEGIFNDLVSAGFAYFTEDSKFSSPVVLVTYPDHRKPRLTGDFSGSNGVNSHTIPVDPNLPRISDVLEFLSSANYIATLDLPKAFWQLNVATKDQEKTTLSIPGMSIAFKRACFGLKNVPAIFQNIMSSIFDIPGVFIYIDDVIIVASTFDEFLDKIGAVLSNARSRRVNIGLQKCTFTTCNHPIKILGHVFLKKTRSIDSSRISALVELPPPKNVKEVRSFVGSVNYLRDWLPQISEELAPIIELTRGSESGNRAPPIKWTHDHQLRFERIKRMIIDHVPLSLPDKDSKILISTDASDLAVGGVIWQEMPPCAPAGTPLIDRKVTPLSFFSRILQNSQKNWSTIQKELYAIILILTESTLSGFLLSRKLTIFTDHKNIAFLYSAPEKNRIVKRWIPILAEFSIEIVHTTGSDNHWADMLSRILPDKPHANPDDSPVPIGSLHVPPSENYKSIQQIDPVWIKCISECISNDLPLFSSLLSKIRSEQVKAFKNKDKTLVMARWDDKSQLYLNKDNKIIIPEALRSTILLNFHGLVQSGHPSLKTSLDRLKESDFFWPSMIADMSRHVQCCPSCQKTSPVRKPNIPFTGTLWSDRPFSSVHVDTIGPLPKDQQDFSFVLVFVDSFTRYTILVPLTKLNAQESAYALVWNVCAIFGIPLAIHSDNGPEFANAIFRGLCDILAIESSNSVPHYSQSNGLVEC
ncbi:hypothetical protein RCL1_003994 [Eukaryota sp. TZLM3-RCL]